MCLSISISDWKIILRFFVDLFCQLMLESILVLKFGLLKCFGLKRRYFVLFESTDNLFAIIPENTFLIHDSINEKIVVSFGERNKYIWLSLA